MKRNTVLLILLLSSFGASAQIEGNVVDTSGKAIPNATIIIIDSVKNSTDSVKADKTGFFEFKKLNRGKYKIMIKAAGFQNSIHENILVNNETPVNNPGGGDISNALWLEVVMKPAKRTK